MRKRKKSGSQLTREMFNSIFCQFPPISRGEGISFRVLSCACKMGLLFVCFVLLCTICHVGTDLVRLSDFDNTMYLCETSTQWKKGCRFYDFSVGSCRPWRIDACPEPFVQQRMSSCVHQNSCRVLIYNFTVKIKICIFCRNCLIRSQRNMTKMRKRE